MTDEIKNEVDETLANNPIVEDVEVEDIIPEPVKGEYSRCKTCKHMAEAHGNPGDFDENGSNCSGDFIGETCICREYVGGIIE